MAVYQLYQHRNKLNYSLFTNNEQRYNVIGGSNASLNAIVGLINTITKQNKASNTICYYTCADTRLGNFELKKMAGVSIDKPLTSVDLINPQQ